MHDPLDENNSPAEPDLSTLGARSKTANGQTGPRTPEGKSKSSMNRLTHGCRSEKTLLPDEDPAEFDFVVNSWFTQYDPKTTSETMLVEETARAHWFFKRASRRLEQIECTLPADACAWTPEHHHSFQNFSRYKTAAERSFLRFHKELEAHGDRTRRIERAKQQALNIAARIDLQWLTREQEKTADELQISQWIEVETIDGQCRTTFSPTNKKLLEQAAARPSPPLYLTRFVNFQGGVPPAYDWVRPNLIQLSGTAIGVQRMPYGDWLEVIEREKAAGTGHIGPLGIFGVS